MERYSRTVSLRGPKARSNPIEIASSLRSSQRRWYLVSTLSLLLFVAPGHAAETLTAKQIRSANRLIPLDKITVGPDDQYRGSVDPSGQTLVFTRKSDLVPHLCRQDLRTGDVTDFLPLSADSQEPAISAEGLVAFTYYRFSARGDICYRPLQGKENEKITCLKGDEGERSAPFWRSPRELGYITRDMRTLVSRIVAENIDSGSKQVLAEGRVWSPAIKTGGRYLFYNELVGTGSLTRFLVMKDLSTGKTKNIHIALPGFSGFPAVSEDEKMLFFSHYLNDTNSDNVIDGNDNSVIFRAPIATLLSTDMIFPEQLTSAESNCSFPRPFHDQIYVTCALEGDLDIYRVPQTGIVPTAWDEKLLLSAHQTSRTYQERVLVLDTLKYRYPARESTELLQRLLSDHLLSGDTSAARYYLESLLGSGPKEKKDYYRLLRLYITGLERKSSQASEEVSPAFQREIAALEAQANKVNGQPRFKKIVRGLFRTFLGQAQASYELLRQVRFDSGPLPETMERNIFFELAGWTLPRVKKGEASFTATADIYRQMMTAPELSNESRIYYAFQFLKYLEASKPSRSERIAYLGRFEPDLSEPVLSLIKAEAATLKIIEASGDAAKTVAYRDLNTLMTTSQSDYFLRKALYVRSILNFASAADFRYLGMVTTNWLRYTADADTEYLYAREVFVDANLDQGYDNFAERRYSVAAGYFLGSLSLTDDLESHTGYIRSRVLNHERKSLDARYQELQKRSFIDDNMKFVEALLTLIDAPPSTDDLGALDQAVEKLKAMQQDRDSAVRYLLLGYCYLEKLLRTGSGYDFDHQLFENAHRNLMLAYDIGRDNARIKASSLMDLGILHQRAQNHGTAVKFFSRREALGFTSTDESARFAWLYGRSLFFAQQADRASEVLTRALEKAPASFKGPFLERKAFYHQAAGNYGKAADTYQRLFQGHVLQGDMNLAKAYLSYGFCLFKLKREKEAREALVHSLDYLERLKRIERGKDRWVDFQPVRLKLDVYGLLSRLGTPAERLAALENRGRLLPEAKGLYDDELSLGIQNRVQAAELYSLTNPSQAALRMKEAIRMAGELGDSGQYLSHAVYQTTVDFLVHGILHPEQYRNEDSGQVKRMVDKTIQAYNAQKNAQPVLEYQKLKLQLLWAGYSRKVLKAPSADAASLREKASASPVRPEELTQLAKEV